MLTPIVSLFNGSGGYHVVSGRLQLGEEGGGERGTIRTLVQLDEVGSCMHIVGREERGGEGGGEGRGRRKGGGRMRGGRAKEESGRRVWGGMGRFER